MLQDSEQGCPSRNVQLDKITFFLKAFILWKGILGQTSEHRSRQEAVPVLQKVAPEYLPVKACLTASPGMLVSVF